MKRYRNYKGQFSRNYYAAHVGILLMILTILLGLYFQSQQPGELISPIPRAETFLDGVPQVRAKEPEIVPTSTPKSLTEKQQILNYIVEVFGDDAPDAIVVIRKCENSKLDPYAVNHNRNGSVDRGIFQLNSEYWGGEELFDWKTNVDVAYKVFTRAGKTFKPWTCAHVVGQKNYLGK